MFNHNVSIWGLKGVAMFDQTLPTPTGAVLAVHSSTIRDWDKFRAECPVKWCVFNDHDVATDGVIFVADTETMSLLTGLPESEL